MTTEPLPKKPGRPPLETIDRKTLVVGVRLSPSQYDALAKTADEARVSLADVLRRGLAHDN